MPRPSTRAANHRFWIAQDNDAMSISGSRAAAKNVPFAVVHQRRHQHFSAVMDAFDFELHKLVGALARRFGGAHALCFHQLLNLSTQCAVADADKPPGLHQADTGRLMGSLEQAMQHWGPRCRR